MGGIDARIASEVVRTSGERFSYTSLFEEDSPWKLKKTGWTVIISSPSVERGSSKPI
jgi:hypothetical protein